MLKRLPPEAVEEVTREIASLGEITLETRRNVFGEFYNPLTRALKLVSLRRGNEKLIFTPRREGWEMYDLASDVTESRPITPDRMPHQSPRARVHPKGFVVERAVSGRGSSSPPWRARLKRSAERVPRHGKRRMRAP